MVEALAAKPLRVFVVAGEASGDRLGGQLLADLRALSPRPLLMAGLGGAEMRAAGLTPLFDMDEISVMGLWEVLPRLPRILWRLRQTIRAAIAFRPDVLITIDSPDFCLRVARGLKAARPDVPVVHYVAPSVWAWRPERAVKMAAHVDHVLTLLPFEPPLMEAAGMSADFVGHPVAALKAEQLARDARQLVVLPGSRRGEIKRHMPLFLRVMERLMAEVPDLRCVIPTLPHLEAPLLAMTRGRENVSVRVMSAPERQRLFAQSHGALATSGTVSLELAAAGCPMGIAYRASAATERMIKRLAQIDTATLVNILNADRRIPECLFERCTVEEITQMMRLVLFDPAHRAAQIDGCEAALVALGRGQDWVAGAAARAVLAFLERVSPD